MRRLARRIAETIQRCLHARVQFLRRKALERDLAQVFRRLETRRVMSVSADFGLIMPGVLNIAIARGGNSDAGLFADGNEFFVDQDGNQIRDVGEVNGLIADLTQIRVQNAGRPGVGSFLWRGDFSQSNSLQSLMVRGLMSTTVAATANVANDVSLSVSENIAFGDGTADNLSILGNLNASTPRGQISNADQFSIQVHGQTVLNASAIGLGQAHSDFIALDNLNLTSPGHVAIELDDSVHLTGVNNVGSIQLETRGLHSDIRLEGQLISSGDMQWTSSDSVFLSSTSNVIAIGSGNIDWVVNSDGLAGDDHDSIVMQDGSALNADTGWIRLQGLFNAGDITLANIGTNHTTSTAISIETAGSILDGSVAETSNLQASSGAIVLRSLQGSIGSSFASGGIEIVADSLHAEATSGIAMDTDSNTLSAINMQSGDVIIREANSIRLTSVVNAGRLIVVEAQGDVQADSVFASGSRGNIQMTSGGEFFAGSITTNRGSIEIIATGSIVATNLSASGSSRIQGFIHLESVTADVHLGRVVASDDVIVKAFRDITDRDRRVDNLDVSGENVTLIATTGNIGILQGDIFCDTVVNTLEVAATVSLTANAAQGVGAVSGTLQGPIELDAQAFWLQSVDHLDASSMTANVQRLALIADSDSNGLGTLILDSHLAVPIDLYVSGAAIVANAGPIELSAQRLLFVSGASAEIIASNVQQLDASTMDDLFVIVPTLGRIEFVDLNCDNVALETRTLSGSVRVESQSSIAVSNDVIAGNDGDPNSIGSIEIVANASGSGIELTDGSRVIADHGQIVLIADSDIQISSLQTSNASMFAILVATANGGIYDSGDSTPDANLIANTIGAVTTLVASQGIGDTNSLETNVDHLVATNLPGNITLPATGSIRIRETVAGGNLVLSGVRNEASNGDIRIGVDQGDLISEGIIATFGGDTLLQSNGNLHVHNRIGSSVGNGSIHLVATENAIIDDHVIAEANGTIFVDGQTVQIQQNGSLESEHGDILLRSQRVIQSDGTIISVDGSIAIVSGADLIQSGTVRSQLGDVLIRAAGDYRMQPDAQVTAFDNMFVAADGTVLLGILDAHHIRIQAGTDILDGNLDQTNVIAEQLSLQAGGFVGGPSLLSPAGTNPNAIDVAVTAAAMNSGHGIYLEEVDDILIGNTRIHGILVSVLQANLDGRNGVATEDSSPAESDDARSDGPIKIVSRNGSIQVTDGNNQDGIGVESRGSHDILLEARGFNSRIESLADIRGHGGNVSLIAQGDIESNGQTLTELGGTVELQSLQGSIHIGGEVRSETGALLLLAHDSIALHSSVSSVTGSIGVLAGGVVIQNANIDSVLGDVLITTESDLSMSLTSQTRTNSNVLVSVLGNARLSGITAVHVGIQAGGDILDANGVSPNVIADSLVMRAEGTIGGASLLSPESENPSAIDTQVDSLAAYSRLGTYIQEWDGVRVDHVDALTVLVGINRVHFRSDTSPYSVQSTIEALDDLSSAQQVKLVSLNGSISIQDGIDGDGVGIESSGAGSILLEARGLGHNLEIGAAIQSNGGHISLIADAHIAVDADVRTSLHGSILLNSLSGSIDVVGDIRSEDGSILVEAQSDIGIAGNITSNADIGIIAVQDLLQQSRLESTGGNVLLQAGNNISMDSGAISSAANTLLMDAGGDVALGSVVASKVGIHAGGDIHDNNGQLNNIAAIQLSIRSEAGIGGPSLESASDVNPNAIDIAVDKVATSSVLGTYLDEADDVTVGQIDSVEVHVAVDRVNFRSDTTSVLESEQLSSLSDLVSQRQIKLVSENGSVALTDGANGDRISIRSMGAYDVLVESRGENSDLIVNAAVQSTGGSITLLASGMLRSVQAVRTTGLGTILLEASTISVSEIISTESGDILLRASGDIANEGNIESQSGNIASSSGGNTTQSQRIESSAGSISLTSMNDYTMSASASVSAGDTLVIETGGSIALGWLSAPELGLKAGGNIVDANGMDTNLSASNISMHSMGRIGDASLLSAPDVNPNAIDIEADTLAAYGKAAIYVESNGSITIGNISGTTVEIAVERVNFRSDTQTIGSRVETASLDDLTSDGPIKLVSINGSIIVTDGLDFDGLAINSGGDVLIDARGFDGRIIGSAGIESSGGAIYIAAWNQLDIHGDVRTTEQGSILIESSAGGLSISGMIGTERGDIRLQSAADSLVHGSVQTQYGSIALMAGRNLTIASTIAANNGDLWIKAADDFGMFGNASAIAANSLLVQTGGTATLGYLTATHIAIDSFDDIVDGNGIALNLSATELSLRSRGFIGGPSLASSPDTNPAAIDIATDRLAVFSAESVYLEQFGEIEIGHVDSVLITTSVEVVHFRSDTSSLRSQAQVDSLDDAVANGSFKLVATGPIRVTDGLDGDFVGIESLSGGNVLLAARGEGNPIQIDAGVGTLGGHISITADSQIVVNGIVSTTELGAIWMQSFSGDVLVQMAVAAVDGDMLLQSSGDLIIDAVLSTNAGDIGLVAGRDVRLNVESTTAEGDVYVRAGGSFSMSTGALLRTPGNIVIQTVDSIHLQRLEAFSVSLFSENDIVDSNGSMPNVIAYQLSMQARGSIGGSSLMSSPDQNPNAIDTSVDLLATKSGLGTYIEEINSVSINAFTVDVSIDVEQVYFRSDTLQRSESSHIELDGMDSVGPIKLVARDGLIEVIGTVGVSSVHGNLLLEAQGAEGGLRATSNIHSQSGHITLVATGEIVTEGSVRTQSQGTLLLQSLTGAIRNVGPIETEHGDLFIDSASDIDVAGHVRSISGNIGLRAGGNVVQSSDIRTQFGNAFVVSQGSYNMSNAATLAAQEQIVVQANQNVGLGSLIATHIGLQSGGDIVDNNGSQSNVSATTASISALGFIGGPSLSSASNVNPEAIDTHLTTLAASGNQGIYIQEADSIEVAEAQAVASNILVHRVLFRSDTEAIESSSQLGALSDLESEGVIKLVTDQGSVQLSEGGDSDGVAIQSRRGGDVLVAANDDGGTSSIVVDASIHSAGGNVHLSAALDITIAASVETQMHGTVLIQADAGDLAVRGTIQSEEGDILLQAGLSITLDAGLGSSSGDLGLVAGTLIQQNANILSQLGNVAAQSAQNYTMESDSRIEANDIIAIVSGEDIVLASLIARNVGLQSAANIIDNNGTRLNIESDSLSLRAGSSIGDASLTSLPSVNPNAIDIAVSVLAMETGQSGYVEELDDILVGHVVSLGVTLETNAVHFRSDTSPYLVQSTIAALDDLSSAQHVKLVSQNGSITLHDGIDGDGVGIESTGGGNILLEARGIGHGIEIGAAIQSDGGNISLIAEDSIYVSQGIRTSASGSVHVQTMVGSITVAGTIQNDQGSVMVLAQSNMVVAANIVTGGDIGLISGGNIEQLANLSTSLGSILIDVGQSVTMSLNTVTSAGGDLVLIANGQISLGALTATRVGLQSGADIIDINGSSLNVSAIQLSMRASGRIGGPSLDSHPHENPNAIDTSVSILSAKSRSGTYVEEVHSVTIGQVDQISVAVSTPRVNFRSDITSVSEWRQLDRLSDLESDSQIKLVSNGGFIELTDGSDGDGRSIATAGDGDILVEARGVDSKIVSRSSIVSDGGHISLIASGDIAVTDSVETNENGSVYFHAIAGTLDLSGVVKSQRGDILLQSGLDSHLHSNILSTWGDIGVVSRGRVIQSHAIEAYFGNILIATGDNYTMSSEAISRAGSTILVESRGSITLGYLESTHVRLQAQTDVFDGNDSSLNIAASTLSMQVAGMVGGPSLSSPANENPNAIDTSVATMAATSGTGIYVQETDGIIVGRVGGATVDISVEQVQFRSDRVEQTQTRTQDALEDITSGGPIKLVSDSGAIDVRDGNDGDGVGLESTGVGDILLNAMGIDGDILVSASVLSHGGNISIIADRSTHVAGPIFAELNGSILVESIRGNTSVVSSIHSVDGSIRIFGHEGVTVGAPVLSSAGDIAIVSKGSVSQGANVLAITGSVLVDSVQPFQMNSDVEIRAGSNVVVTTQSFILLGLIAADNVALSAIGNIMDGNEELLNVVARHLAIRTESTVGDQSQFDPVDENRKAIDTDVDVIAVQAIRGSYIQEKNSVVIGSVDAVEVTVGVNRVHFRSDLSTVVDVGLVQETIGIESHGPIKLVANEGEIRVAEAIRTTSELGNILLRTRGDGHSILVDARIESLGSHISLISSGVITIHGALVTLGQGTIFIDSMSGFVTIADSITLHNELYVRAAQDLTIAGRISSRGDIGLEASGSIVQSADVVSTDGSIFIRSNQDYRMHAGTETASENSVVASALGSIILGRISAANVGLQAQSSIRDGNGSLLNIDAVHLSMRAGDSIGGPSLTSSVTENPNAIDTAVEVLAASSGESIYVNEQDGIFVGNVGIIGASVFVHAVNFRSDTSSIGSSASIMQLSGLSSGLHSKLIANGNIDIQEGNDLGGGGISAGTNGAIGNILIEARGPSLLTINATVRSSGNVSLSATNLVRIEGKLDAASVDVQAADGDILILDTVTSHVGDVLFQAGESVQIGAQVKSQLGNIGLIAGTHVSISSSVIASQGDILVSAGREFSMHTDAKAEASKTFIAMAGDQISLGQITASHVRLEALGSILDGDAANGLNIRANSLSMRSLDGFIGGPETSNTSDPEKNTQAIDISVSTLAAFAKQGVYIQEADAVSIGHVDAASITIEVQRVNFRSDSSIREVSRSAAALSDIVSNGSIKLVAFEGDVLITDGSNANGIGVHSRENGDILVEAKVGNDVLVESQIFAMGGHITIIADDDLRINAPITTRGSGTIYILANNSDSTDAGGISMSGDSSITTDTGNIFMDSRGLFSVALVKTNMGDVHLVADDSIVDANVGVNVIAARLSVISVTNAIAESGNFLETSVSTLAAKSARGIYIEEQNGVAIDRVEPVSVQRVRFNSSRTLTESAALEDLTTAESDIHLVNLANDIVVRAGEDTTSGVVATLGSVLLQSKGSMGDIWIEARIQAAANVTLIANAGAIDELSAQAEVVGNHLAISSGQHVHLHNTHVQSLHAIVGAAGRLDGTWQVVNQLASDRGDDFLVEPSHRSENEVDSFLSQHDIAINGTRIDTQQYRFADKYVDYALYLVNNGSMNVSNVSAGTSASPHVYLEAVGASADLIINESVITTSIPVLNENTGVVDLDEGGIVLIAGRDFILHESAILETRMDLRGVVIVQQINEIGNDIRMLNGQLDTRYLNAQFYDAGQGIEVDSPTMTSTRTVVPLYPQTSGADLDFETHVFQRVAMQFGSLNESGFITFIGYADRSYQVFDVASEVGSRQPISGVDPIPSFPTSNHALAATFVRSTEYSSFFLSDNQYLPTDAIVRRASDFFIFENANAVDPMAIRDLTFEAAPILDVITRGDLGGSPLPPDLAQLQPPEAIPFALPTLFEVPNLLESVDIELAPIVEPTRSVVVYRVIYNDVDMDGQPDPLELPSPDEVLDQIADSDIQSKTPLGQKLERLKLVPKTVDGSSPTPADIEAFKAMLRSDPEVPAGAYAIVETQGESQSEVLDVFEVRDFEEARPDNNNELPLIPSVRPMETEQVPIPLAGRSDDSAYVRPQAVDEVDVALEQCQSGRLTAMGVMFGSLWAIRQSSTSRAGSAEDALRELGRNNYSARARRLRRLESICKDRLHGNDEPLEQRRMIDELGEST